MLGRSYVSWRRNGTAIKFAYALLCNIRRVGRRTDKETNWISKGVWFGQYNRKAETGAGSADCSRTWNSSRVKRCNTRLWRYRVFNNSFSCSYIIDQMFDRNASLEQKQIILASIILGVRELAGMGHSDDHQVSYHPLWLLFSISEQCDGCISAGVARFGKVGKYWRAACIDYCSRDIPRVFSTDGRGKEEKDTTQSTEWTCRTSVLFPFACWVVGGSSRPGKVSRVFRLGRTNTFLSSNTIIIRSWMGRDALLAERFIMTLNVIMHCASKFGSNFLFWVILIVARSFSQHSGQGAHCNWVFWVCTTSSIPRPPTHCHSINPVGLWHHRQC